MRDDARGPERIALLLFLATFLFVGALRAFLSAVYYDNLVALELGPTAAFSLMLLAPALFFLPLRPRATLLGAAVALAAGRALLAPLRGTALHLPVAGIAAAAFLLLLGALLPRLRAGEVAAAAVGIALGWAADVALLWYDDSADPTRALRGLLLVLPMGALLLLAAWQVARPSVDRAAEASPRGGWLAGAALGAWLFLENTLAGNPYGAARWNGLEPPLVAGASLLGLALGALLLARVRAWPRAALLALHAGALLAVLDHAFLHTPAFPLLLALLQAALVVDLALLLPRVTPRALLLTGLVALLAHFLYAFTFLFDFVPLSSVWEGQAPTLYVLAALLLLAPLARAPAGWTAPPMRRTLAVLLLVPVAVGIVAAATTGARVEDDRDAGALRVLTFNVHQGFANDGTVDPDAFLPLLRAADADVVFLQEADTPRFTSGNVDVAGYLGQQLGYTVVYGQPTRAQAFGGALLTRVPVKEWTAHELPSESDDRWYLEARLDVDGRDVWAYSVHFALPHEDRMAEARALLAQAATRSGPVILAGDFNSCPGGLCAGYEEGVSDDVYAQMTARYTDAWVAAGNAADAPEGYTYEANDPHERIDHVYVSSDIDVESVERIRTPEAIAASDHLPVRVDVTLR